MTKSTGSASSSGFWKQTFLFGVALTIASLFQSAVAHESEEAHTGHVYRIEETILNARMPKGISDHTATLVGNTVYLAGGCDAPLGNVYNPDSQYFECGSISKSFFALDLSTVDGASSADFVALPDMPVARYRHAATAANGKIWIHGGRSLVDDLITDVHVYDIAERTWTTLPVTDSKYHLSDHTGFSHGKYAFFAGGYLADYTAVGTTFRIDAEASVDELVIEDRALMLVERGDVSSVATSEYAITTGGFTHVNEFSAPLVHAERYSFESNTWSEIASIEHGGGERALVTLDDGVYALGGERQLEGLDEMREEDKPEPGEQTVTLDQVERYDSEDNEWTTLSPLPDPRFRFPAVGYSNFIFTFGGQLRYDETCECFKTSDFVIYYEETVKGSSAPPGLSRFLSGFMVLATTIAAVLWV